MRGFVRAKGSGGDISKCGVMRWGGRDFVIVC